MSLLYLRGHGLISCTLMAVFWLTFSQRLNVTPKLIQYETLCCQIWNVHLGPGTKLITSILVFEKAKHHIFVDLGLAVPVSDFPHFVCIISNKPYYFIIASYNYFTFNIMNSSFCTRVWSKPFAFLFPLFPPFFLLGLFWVILSMCCKPILAL